MKTYVYKDKKPVIAKSCFVAAGARIVGDVVLQENVSVWFNTVIRGDSGQVVVGANTNIQDNCTLHTDKGVPCMLGENVTVGHNAVVHACKVGDNCLIGMNATILSGAIIGENSIVAAGAVLGERKEVPSGTLYAGVPAKFIRNLSDEEQLMLKQAAYNYLNYAKEYK
ncbi:MAG: gamma carbonic anhydrase family protein [Negativicutes bacterium]|jgi:carbonic anhydrase/acetyltransferase-like protein (isoleucine patch superfamily)